MNELLLILIFVFFTLIVVGVMLFIFKYFIDNEQKKKILELKFHSKEIITPLRLQAYERMALFLERIDPNQLLFRVGSSDLTAYQMQTLLLATIRNEFEHNLSQQIYISIETWESIKNAKEKIVNLVNLSAGKLDENASSTELASALLEAVADYSPIAGAMEMLKKEVMILF